MVSYSFLFFFYITNLTIYKAVSDYLSSLISRTTARTWKIFPVFVFKLFSDGYRLFTIFLLPMDGIELIFMKISVNIRRRGIFARYLVSYNLPTGGAVAIFCLFLCKEYVTG